MKTNQIMVRPMGEFKVTQRTCDGFFNATELLKQWNSHVDNQQILNTQKNGVLKKKDLDDYMNNSSTSDYIKVILEKENIHSGKGIIDATRGKHGGTWVHPMLFIDISMWINPYFKYDVVKFVQDEMIKFRNLSGDAYPTMCKAVKSIKIADESKLRELYELEMNIAQWIEIGIVKNYQQLKSALTNLYYKKHPNVLPI